MENAGARRLILVEERDECCGQAPDANSIIVTPGDSQNVTVEIDTSQWHGSLKHTTRYRTNDPRVPQFTLMVTAMVE
jgi:hypothetical protein